MSFFGKLISGAMSLAAEVDSEGGIYAPGRGREYSYEDADEIPAEMGTYRILSKDDNARKILYIGISKNLRRRILEHKRIGIKFKSGEFVAIKIANTGTTFDELCEHERKKIDVHNPERNERGGGGGRRAELDIDY